MTHDMVPPESRGRRRIWLAIPIVSIAILVLGWSALWIVARHEAAVAMDAWFAAEAAKDRHWTCPDRGISGFPFGIVVSCREPRFEGRAGGGRLSATLTQLTAEGYLYQPNALDVALRGPMRLRDAEAAADTVVSWSELDVTLRLLVGPRLRAAVAATGVTVEASGGATTRIDHIDWRIGPASGRPAEERSYDLVVQMSGGAIPALDALLGNADPLSVDETATVTAVETPDLEPWPVLAERWRAAGGVIDLTALTLVKGPVRIVARGQLGLDEMHRAAGRLQLALSGYEAFAERLGLPVSAVSFGGALSAILGQRGAQATPDPPGDRKALTIPALLADGRVMVGPFKTSLRLPPLY